MEGDVSGQELTRLIPSRMDELARIEPPARRGIAFEKFVADVFRKEHFRVSINSRAARPRQTDLLATKANETYLVECKWRSDKANINDIDSLRSRLRRTNIAVVGVLASVTGFTDQVVADVGNNRHQPILLLSGKELRLIDVSFKSLSSVLWRKKDALLTDGRVLVDAPSEWLAPGRRSIPLPSSESHFLLPDGKRTQVIECGGSFGQFVFADYLVDIDWAPGESTGVVLDVNAQVYDESGLLDLIDKLADLGWASRDARWSIHQATRNWHGLGCAAFTEELHRWEYRANTAQAHHSEEICYADYFDGGFFTLTAKIGASEYRDTTFTLLSFQLPGIPLDTGPLVELCRSVGVYDGLYFRPRAEASVKRDIHVPPLCNDIKAIGYVVTSTTIASEEPLDFISGIVVQTPDNIPDDLRMLRDSEQLICGLTDHYPLEWEDPIFNLRGFEHAWSADAMICRPVVRWERPETTRPPLMSISEF